MTVVSPMIQGNHCGKARGPYPAFQWIAGSVWETGEFCARRRRNRLTAESAHRQVRPGGGGWCSYSRHFEERVQMLYESLVWQRKLSHASGRAGDDYFQHTGEGTAVPAALNRKDLPDCGFTAVLQ